MLENFGSPDAAQQLKCNDYSIVDSLVVMMRLDHFGQNYH